MAERSIVCTADEVRRLLAGEVMEIRRAMKPQPELWQTNEGPRWAGKMPDGGFHDIENDALGRFAATCPLGAPGERRWVAEAWALKGLAWSLIDTLGAARAASFAAPEARLYEATDNGAWKHGWEKAETMPRVLSRVSVEIAAVTCERSADAKRWEWVVTAKPVEETIR